MISKPFFSIAIPFYYRDENSINQLYRCVNSIKNQTFKSYDIEIVEFIKDGFGDDVINRLRNALLDKMDSSHIDFFKNYNDRYGHQQGDEALVKVAAALKSQCRREGEVHRGALMPLGPRRPPGRAHLLVPRPQVWRDLLDAIGSQVQ